MNKKVHNARFTIGLKENGLHSLRRGMESFQEYDKVADKWFLKETVMFLHHGIELLMKEILVRQSEYLIFENFGQNTIKKQKMATKEGVGIFYLPKPPRTVTYLDAIDRVEAFVHPVELDEHLLSRLRQLNQYRNQLEHYAVDADAEAIAQVIADLHEPLLELFEAQLGPIEQKETAAVIWARAEMQRQVTEHRRMAQEVYALVQRFKGQEVPGRLLNVSEELALPDFVGGKVRLNYRPSQFEWPEIDVYGESEQSRWIIEVKAVASTGVLLWALSQVSASRAMLNAQGWLVVFADVSARFKETARQQNVMVTGASEWRELKRIIETDSPGGAA